MRALQEKFVTGAERRREVSWKDGSNHRLGCQVLPPNGHGEQ
jgi:hypothetical protein